jgi:sulfide:quinone oxidoreductase
MAMRVVVLGAGFGGLELCTLLSETLGSAVDATLIDKSDAFVFGYSKLDVMFGRTELAAVRLPYDRFNKEGVRFRRETVAAIDPAARRVTTNAGTYEADVLVIALGADYDFDATPGLAAGGDEFYTEAGADRLRAKLPAFAGGRAIVGVSAAPYKCPPAPSECALLLHDYLTMRRLRKRCEITMILPLPSPVPPSPGTSKALVQAFAERDIKFLPSRRVASLDPGRRVAVLDDGNELGYDLYFGVPKHRAPKVVEACGIAVAGSIIARVRQGEPGKYAGAGSCYIEFGAGRIGRVDVDFFSGPKPTGTYHEPTVALRSEKERFGSSRRARWFGLA